MEVLEGLKQLPDASVDCVFTSPPYWGLRDYGVDGQLGLESTPQEFVNKLISVFDEVKRVLKPTGTCWINLGDTYYTKSGSNFENDNLNPKSAKELSNESGINKANQVRGNGFLPDKSLCNVPARFSIGMQDKGWILRNTIIWHKPNCMPSSVKDRFTVDFEYVFFFVKEKKYFFEQQYEEASGRSSGNITMKGEGLKGFEIRNGFTKISEKEWYKRNMRCVWSINPEPYREAHFACFPTELVRRGLKAGCPKQICKKCGKPKEKYLGEEKEATGKFKESEFNSAGGRKHYLSEQRKFKVLVDDKGSKNKFFGFSDCGCGAGFEGGVVLDPFVGSGTTLFVAQELGLKGIGIDLNAKYVPLMKKRLLGHENQTSLNPKKVEVIIAKV